MDTTTLLEAAARGDQAAWDALVDRYASLLWSIARAHRLPDADAVQTVWLKLVENLGRIKEPERLPGWLATTTRHECLRQLRRTDRERATDDQVWQSEPAPGPAVDAALLLGERDAALWRALDKLSDQCRRLLRVLMATPPPSYAEVADALDIPVGSIGPTRQRCLGRLRERAGQAGLGTEDRT
ncbi:MULTISPECIES: sigma-70 family RNA polymerase sigma factor [unclassified Amycolatopsis]|uniref:RNA polymerase sigma factor n=1 Tax=unclassified Amycolatopsis TaxID=2618356 RepID=UPI0028771F5C|nr:MULTISPECIES: sigma-70 family RNA polymerase sigma factor [unclassified Amycolatopsis]MDS0139205.1 sigma-70 family RNA polymerase sigma factor [Amycolatopsis sp. 505]MDS0144437.1 sigma-70 family RNA polymerase sigma factor [Amycolatopsis sp. CM201R]